tara:strand:- start:2131 stop:2496 length:366 start_codon:yes stop_codon:yes gene_type:complete
MELSDIKKGILNNLAVRNQYTLEVDPVLEGNSYFGLCIFVGVARMFNFSLEEIQDYLRQDMEHVKFLEGKFLSILDSYFNTKDPSLTTKGFYTKTNLILNHIRLEHKKIVSLADIIKEKIK